MTGKQLANKSRFGGSFFMPIFGSKDARKPPGRVLVEKDSGGQNGGKGGEGMQELVRRLIDSGMSRAVALCALRQIQDPKERELYVELIEEEAHEPMETI